MVRAMAAPFDGDWPNLCDPTVPSENGLQPHKGRVAAAGEAATQLFLDQDDPSELSGGDGCFSPEISGGFRSIEDLMNGFDERISACFGNADAKTDCVAPVSVIAEDTLLEKDE